jgi:hypothetical protein
VVARAADRQLLPGSHEVVHALRAAAACCLAQDGDPPPAGFVRIAAEGVLPDEPGAEIDVDVRPGRPLR